MEKTFEMIGFKHITVANAAMFYSTLDSRGSIELLHDLTNQDKLDILMGQQNFDMMDYIKSTGRDTDEVMVELHEELCDARFMLEYAFMDCQTDIRSNVEPHRSFKNIDAIATSGEWTGRSYPLWNQRFEDTNSLSVYVQEHCTEHVVRVKVSLNSTTGYPQQMFDFQVSGAEEFNAIADFINAMVTIGYEASMFV